MQTGKLKLLAYIHNRHRRPITNTVNTSLNLKSLSYNVILLKHCTGSIYAITDINGFAMYTVINYNEETGENRIT